MGKLAGGQSLKYRKRVADRYGVICYLCKHKFEFEVLTLEHLIPVKRGGTLKGAENHALACDPCNNKKSGLTVEEYCKVYDLNLRDYPRLGRLKTGLSEPLPITNTADLVRLVNIR